MNHQSIKSVLVISFILIFTFSFAQNFQGVVTYKSSRKSFKPNDKLEINKENDEISKRLAKAFQKEFTLIFNKNESLFKVKESLEKPNPMNGGMVVRASLGTEVVYKNAKESRFAMEREIFGKKFLVKDSLEKKAWKIVDQTKQIGNYLCKKAVITKTYKKREVSEDGSFKFVDEEKDMIAWFTMEIPVNQGPSHYYGLPGLILEIEDGRVSFLCTKIVLNPKEKVKIEEPRKGKVVSQKEFDKIFKDKMKESRANFRRPKID